MSREHIHVPGNLGDKVADSVVSALGSWRFIIIQASILFLWFVLNSVGWFYHFDTFPFILCNLFMSAEAAFASPLILMASNRAATRDRKRDDTEAVEVQGLFDNHEELLQINHTQLDILNQEQGTRQALDLIAKRLDMLEIQARTTVYASGTPLLPPQGEQKKGKVS